MKTKEKAQHMAHCYQGEYEATCKYGDENCPAKPTEKPEFDLNKVYQKELSKKELLRIIKATYDKKFIVLFLPRTKDNADILIRSFKEQFKE